jgi:hypothetical protein
MDMLSPFISAVVFPLLATLIFTILEFVGDDLRFWDKAPKISLDMCIVSIGITGGFTGNDRMLERLQGQMATFIAGFLLVQILLAVLVMLFSKRLAGWNTEEKGRLCLSVGSFAVAIPSVMLLWIGR